MGRTMLSLFAWAMLLQGCVIYETESWHDRCRAGDDDEDCLTGPREGDPSDEDPLDDEDLLDDEDPIDDEDPETPFKIWLSVAEGRPGDSLLTWLESDGDLDFRTIDRITFVGDVEVTDSVFRDDEAFLLLQIPHDAQPGVVQGFVELRDGGAALLSGGFTVLEPLAGGDGTCDCSC